MTGTLLRLVAGILAAMLLPAASYAINPKNEVLPVEVALGASNGIESEYVAVPDKYTRDAARYALYLTLVELRSSGENVPLGEQTVALSETTLVTENGPDGRDVFDVSWVTQGVFANSRIQACAQVLDLMTGNAHGGLLCQTLTPAD
jgi:hypothetical protein